MTELHQGAAGLTAVVLFLFLWQTGVNVADCFKANEKVPWADVRRDVVGATLMSGVIGVVVFLLFGGSR